MAASENAKILVAESQSVIALDIKRSLEGSGCNVVGCVSSGEEVMKIVSEQKVDLLIIDKRLKGKLNGVKTSKMVWEKFNIPIIFLISGKIVENMSAKEQTSPSVFITKPFKSDDLHACVETTLHNHRANSNDQTKEAELIEMLTAENEKLKKAKELQEMNIEELTETNKHLITATFREREMKQQLSATLDELEVTKGNLEHQNIRIRESISYAETIQGSILPDNGLIQKYFPDSFMYYIPKDVVSGDFPWFQDKGDDLYIAAVDCTGHGVPGAMMSFVGYFLLNEITGHRKILSPASVLERLHLGVVRTLRQDQESCKNARDGMDIALCKINLKEMELEYAGAHRPLYLVQDGELSQIKGDKNPIGGIQWKKKKAKELVTTPEASNGISVSTEKVIPKGLTGENFRPFTNHKVKINPGDSIFFFSDGLPDQFGGPEELKYGPKRIRDLIVDNLGQPMGQMAQTLKDDFESWSKGAPQIDDVLMIGIGF